MSLLHQKCMETKNNTLARQKEMQLSLDKVKHLIRLIQAFNFTQALTETEDKEVRVQDRAGGAACSDAAPKVNSVENVKAGSPSASGSADGTDERESGAAGSDKTAAAGNSDGQVVLQHSGVLMAVRSSAAEAVAAAGGGGNIGTGLQTEGVSKAETGAAPSVGIPASSATVVTTNGTTEPTCPDRSPTGGCATSTTTNSENEMAAVNPPETVVEKKQEATTDSDGSNINNSKTSEPSQHSLPALVSSLDDKK